MGFTHFGAVVKFLNNIPKAARAARVRASGGGAWAACGMRPTSGPPYLQVHTTICRRADLPRGGRDTEKSTLALYFPRHVVIALESGAEVGGTFARICTALLTTTIGELTSGVTCSGKGVCA